MARGRKYPLGKLAVGQSILIPWAIDASGGISKDQDVIHAAIRQEQRLYRKVFVRAAEIAGLRVTRVC